MRPKFAVVREDPALESTLVRRSGAAEVLLVASGGCTALSLAALHPGLRITAFDLSRAQLDHVARKTDALLRGELVALGLGSRDPHALHQLGHFEGLFRLLRSGVVDLVGVDPVALAEGDPTQHAACLASPYWPALFATLFGDPLLHAMFGPDATQHAAPGSYPAYFQRAFERGLAGPPNPFVRHVFAQDYVPGCAPPFLERPPAEVALELVEGDLLAVPRLERFGVIALSNVFDWSSDALVTRWAAHLAAHARPGALILVRKLNNDRDLGRAFDPARFAADDALGAELLAADRSLFYSRIEVLRVR